MNFGNEKKDEVWSVVRAMNDAWTRADGGTLSRYFHPRMVAMNPVDRFRRKGAEACIAGWQNFARSSTIHAWREDDPDIEVFGDTAAVTYYYCMDVTMGGKRMTLSGRDMLTMVKENGRWWLAANHFSSYDPCN